VEKIAQARGFDNRTAVSKPVKEPLKPLQFRLRESKVNAFRQRAYEGFGRGRGAIIALFARYGRTIAILMRESMYGMYGAIHAQR
jgi:hypothetical protein